MNVQVPIRAAKEANLSSQIAGATGLLESEAYIRSIEALRRVWMIY